MSSPRRPIRPRGFVLLSGLLFLVLLTLLSVAMFRSVGLQESIAGHTRDKQRAFEAAQTALQYGEWWLTQGVPGMGVACSGVVNGNTVAAMRVCADPLQNAATLPWPTRIEYQPPSMAVAAGGGLAADGDVNYQARPGLHLHYLGMTPDGLGLLYQVSASALGGRSDTAAVVQSTYRIASGVKDLGKE
jgi:type IV pilus assembly protein PilX